MILNNLITIVLLLQLLVVVRDNRQNKIIDSLQLDTMEQQNKYVGMWVTGDGYIRQELLADGRYDEARGNKKSAYTGRYEISGTHIRYWDDTGFTATGDFKGNDTLHHAGYIFYREIKK